VEGRGGAIEWWEAPVRGVTLRGTTQRRGGLRRTGEPSVVAFHGGPGVDGAGLRHLFRSFGDRDVVVPDQRGHGRSDRVSLRTWTLDDWADDAVDLLDALGLHRPVVMGISFGGWVALRLAARHPDQVGALVVAATTARLPTLDEGVARMTELGGPASGAAWRALHEDEDVAGSMDASHHVGRLMSVRNPSTDLAAIRAAQIKTPEVNRHFTPEFQRLDLTQDARAVQCCSVLVIGDKDPLTTPALAQATYDALPDPKRLRLIPDAAHDLIVDSPDALLAEVRWAVSCRT
jgi:pimeloyl-ACP methyl ester carboxylesterase